ncbi:Magnesium and cobalt efflux protein CorC [Raoultella ornithinolytica]|nr:Magnesium and cobalt efflux protein CorC [Raoultella ornithinolytica]
MDPSIWIGLLTLVVLEIVLGIDNLVFIAILADKLPPKQRDKARLIGLTLALFMRLGLLSVISWMVTLTKPLFSIADFSFSGRDLIMLLGGYSCCLKRPRNCMNGWKTASTMPDMVKVMPVSGWWCCKSSCWMRSSRWMQSLPPSAW